MGAKIRNLNELHGRAVMLKRGGREVPGVLVAQDSRANSDHFAFKWQDENGVYIDAVSDEELKNLKAEFNPILTQPIDQKKEVKDKKG